MCGLVERIGVFDFVVAGWIPPSTKFFFLTQNHVKIT